MCSHKNNKIKYKLSKDQAASIKNAIKFLESMYTPEQLSHFVHSKHRDE